MLPYTGSIPYSLSSSTRAPLQRWARVGWPERTERGARVARAGESGQGPMWVVKV